jgi:hypothetical protein
MSGHEDSKSKIGDFEAAQEIKTILDGRDTIEQERILRWVGESLGLAPAPPGGVAPPPAAADAAPSKHAVHPTAAPQRPRDIKTFVDEKQPKSDQQFAAVVAYFYRFETGEADRKDVITSADLQNGARHVGRARFKQPSVTLNNTVNQGYLDRVDRGSFKINAVGENLVAMALPGSADGGISMRKPRSKKPAKRQRKATG